MVEEQPSHAEKEKLCWVKYSLVGQTQQEENNGDEDRDNCDDRTQ